MSSKTAARVELDPEARVELLIEASNIVNDEAAVGVMVFRKEVAAVGPAAAQLLPERLLRRVVDHQDLGRPVAHELIPGSWLLSSIRPDQDRFAHCEPVLVL